MSAEDASSELRMLRAKAYGPDGGLSSVELARLQELEGWGKTSEPAEALGTRAPGPSTGSGAGASDPSEDSPIVETASPIAEPVEALGTGASAPSTGSGAEVRRRWPVIFGTAAALLAIGLGVGWGIWGWDSRQFALAAAHGEERAELESSGSYDPGTVVPIAEQHGAVVWRADRSNGLQLCVIVTTPDDEPRDGCIPYDQVADSGWPSAMGTVPEGQEDAGQQLAAGLIPTASGELVPYIQVWDASASDWESQYSDSELAQLRQLEAAGYVPTALSAIGYDGDTVIWGSWQNGYLCVVVPTDDGHVETCAENEKETLALTLPVDGAQTEYVVRQTEMRGPQLTIVRHPMIVDVDPETGDVTEFSVDEPMFDDLVIDDKTGDVEQ